LSDDCQHFQHRPVLREYLPNLHQHHSFHQYFPFHQHLPILYQYYPFKGSFSKGAFVDSEEALV
jgi:hypothetical protein